MNEWPRWKVEVLRDGNGKVRFFVTDGTVYRRDFRTREAAERYLRKHNWVRVEADDASL